VIRRLYTPATARSGARVKRETLSAGSMSAIAKIQASNPHRIKQIAHSVDCCVSLSLNVCCSIKDMLLLAAYRHTGRFIIAPKTIAEAKLGNSLFRPALELSQFDASCSFTREHHSS
jgi:hypothetical protein